MLYKQGTILELVYCNLPCYKTTTYHGSYDEIIRVVLVEEKVLLLENKEKINQIVKVLLLKTNQIAKVYLWERYWK